MADGLEGMVQCATVMNGELYVLHSWSAPVSEANNGISKWNGTSWERVVTFSGRCAFYSFAVYREELYVGGAFYAIDSVPGTAGIARWDGHAWHGLGGGLVVGAEVLGMKEYRGDLYIVGSFQNADGVPGTAGIVRWDGAALHSVGGGLANPDMVGGVGSSPYVFDLAEYRGRLYVGGDFSHAGSIHSPFLAVWNGQQWEGIQGGPDREPEHMTVYNDELYVQGPYIAQCGSVETVNLARWNGQRWSPVGQHDWWGNVHDLRVYNGELYASGVGTFNNSIGRWDGKAWTLLGAFDQDPNFLAEYNGSLITGGWFSECGSTPLRHIARMCTEKDCGVISGTVYLDRDADCTWNAEDSALPHRMVMITPGPLFTSTNAVGHYEQYVPPGSYTVSLWPLIHWDQNCPQPPGTYTVSVAGAGDQHTGSDFAMKPQPNVQDIRVSIAASRARPGRQLEYVITYENVGTVTMSGSLTLNFDTRLPIAGSKPLPDSSGLGRLVWNFTDLRVDERRPNHVTMNVPTTMPVGAQLCADAEVEFDHGPDAYFPDDDRDSVCARVTSSCDPNEIEVAPDGTDRSGPIQQSDSVLAYTIHFQNTGTDTAFRVVVVDTLSPNLDPATVRPGAASHPFTFTVNGGCVLTWTFEDIMLPDSTSNETASHGMLKYFASLRPNLASGTLIPNRAAIYFDYNAAVVTNTVITTTNGGLVIQHVDGRGSVALGPNPSMGLVQIEGSLSADAEISVYDQLGSRVKSVPASPAPAQTLDLRELPAGVYLLALPTINGTVMRRVVLVR
ncbi:MAG: T9SS type A sorting domain-containing protein [Bacteroidetes bacterium]|nr:T9SS type A sorting domain-containing protein [Bacteroidota bacterium]